VGEKAKQANEIGKMNEPHIMTNSQFDWERLQVQKFCMTLVNNFDWEFCSKLYIETFVKEGWSFEKFKGTAEYDGAWNDKMFRLEKLHKLSTFA